VGEHSSKSLLEEPSAIDIAAAEGGGVSGELSMSNSLEGGWSAEGNTTLGLDSKHSVSGGSRSSNKPDRSKLSAREAEVQWREDKKKEKRREYQGKMSEGHRWLEGLRQAIASSIEADVGRVVVAGVQASRVVIGFLPVDSPSDRRTPAALAKRLDAALNDAASAVRSYHPSVLPGGERKEGGAVPLKHGSWNGSYLTWSVHDQPNTSLTGIFVAPEKQHLREKLPRAAAGFLSLGAQVRLLLYHSQAQS